MTQIRTYPIACPSCSEGFEVDLYESLNAAENPDLREALIRNKLNEAVCPGCGFTFRVDKPLLYHDPDQRLLVYWIPVPLTRLGEGEDLFNEMVRDLLQMLPDDLAAPEIQMVLNRVELIERIFSAEAGLNPRIIEYIKYQVFTRNGDKVDVGTQGLLLNTHDSTPENLCFVIQNMETLMFEAMLQYPRETYTALQEMFADEEKSVDLIELFPGPYISARAVLLDA